MVWQQESHKSFTVSDLINDNQNSWNSNIIFPFRLTDSFCAIAIADYKAGGLYPTYNLIGDLKIPGSLVIIVISYLLVRMIILQ